VERRPEIWVIGAGDSGRRHQVARVFGREGIVAIGPSRGIQEIEDEIARKESGLGRKLRSKVPGALRRFAGDWDDGVKRGHFVILRSGTREVLDIGVLGGYCHDEDLGIAAWDLGHVRSVTWAGLSTEPEECRKLEGSMNGAFPHLRFSRLSEAQGALRAMVEELVADRDLQPPSGRPTKTHRKVPGEFVEMVYQATSSAEINNPQLKETIDVARSFGDGEGEYRRLEADSVAMVLVPLFNSLGVELPRIRVEVPIRNLAEGEVPAKKIPAKRVDLVVFETEGIEKPILFAEVKRRWNGLDWAASQMDEYLRLMGREGSPNLITDGSEFEIRNIPESAAQRTEDSRREMSLQWLTEGGAGVLARLADYLKRP
jgi:hypothetical protein